jgi:preprotein translocase subunit SecD
MKVFAIFLVAMALYASAARAANKPYVEFYAVVGCASGGAVPRHNPALGLDVCISPRHLLGGADVVGLALVDQPAGEALGIKLGPAGATALYHFSRENIGHQMAILIDGKLVSAPVIQSVLQGDRISVVGLTHGQIVALVARFKAPPPI